MKKLFKTHKIFPLLIILLFVFPFTSVQAIAWTFSADFEKGTLGTKAKGLSGFSGAGTSTLFSYEKAANGKQSAKIVWPKGSEGWGVAHGEIIYPQRVTNEQEIWARGYYYFSSPWSFAAKPVSKILRIHIANSLGNHVGYHSVLAGGDIGTLGHILPSNEVSEARLDTGVLFDIDEWQCIEIYLKLSPNNPITRIWKNGILIYENIKRPTLKSTTDYADFSYILSYWNGGAPQNQIMYVDDFIITTTKPSKFDSKKNSMIGPN